MSSKTRASGIVFYVYLLMKKCFEISLKLRNCFLIFSDLKLSSIDIYSTLEQPLEDRLDEYIQEKGLSSKKPNLTRFPPSFEPVPCRPLFFDLALNHVEFPSLENRLEQQKKSAAGGGLTGMVKGWLWGGSK